MENKSTVATAQIVGHDVCDNVVDLPDVLQIPGVVAFPAPTEVFIMWGVYDCSHFSQSRRELETVSKLSVDSIIHSPFSLQIKVCTDMLISKIYMGIHVKTRLIPLSSFAIFLNLAMTSADAYTSVFM